MTIIIKGDDIMKKEKIAKSVIKTTLSTALRAIEKDPKRSTRDLVEKGLAFSNSRFQAGFFNMISSMLINNDSEYYTLTENISKEVNNEYIYKFGMNIGYNSCVIGAKKIRKIKIEDDIDVPWLIAINYSSKEKFGVKRLKSLLDESRSLGIYFYPIIIESNDVNDLIAIFEKYDDCSFALLIKDNCIDETYIENIEKYKNVGTVLNKNVENFTEICEKIKNKKILYATYLTYDENTIFDDKIFDEVKNETNTFFMMIPTKETSVNKISEAGEFAKKCRFKQNLPFIVVDAISDAEFYNDILTGNSRMLAFDANGTIYVKSKNTIKKDINISSNKLINILKYSSDVDNF